MHPYSLKASVKSSLQKQTWQPMQAECLVLLDSARVYLSYIYICTGKRLIQLLCVDGWLSKIYSHNYKLSF